jgi:hypothetical protein
MTEPQRKRPPRWGLRTLAFLTLTMVALVTAAGLGGNTRGTLGCTVLGIGGALYCTVRGVRSTDWMPQPEPPPEHLDPAADRWNLAGGRPGIDRPADRLPGPEPGQAPEGDR